MKFLKFVKTHTNSIYNNCKLFEFAQH